MGEIYANSGRFNARESFEKKNQERRRNTLYLIKNYLQENGLEKTSESLAKEANLSDQIEVCDNIDLDTIIQEFSSFYFAKFNKHPKICKKVVNEGAKVKSPPRRGTQTPSLEPRTPQKNRPASTENFNIAIKQISNVKVLECEVNNLEEDYEASTPEEKEMYEMIKKEIIPKKLGINWEDCIGLDKTIQLLQEAIILPKKYPTLFSKISPWKGIMLFGPPGTGKTMVARALASESDSVFINLSPSTFVSKWRGESEKLVRILFDVAKHYAPTTIFIDELDALASRRDETQHEASRRFKSELLSQLDGIHRGDSNIFILATTNLPWCIDPAMLRRFDKKIYIPLPSAQSRLELFRRHLNLDPRAPAFKPAALKTFSELTDKFSGSDIKLVCKNAFMNVVRRKIKGGSGEEEAEPTIKDVENAIKNTRPSQTCAEKYEEWEHNFGCI